MKKGFLIYFAIWFVMVLSFYLGLSQSAMGYSLLAFYLVLPLAGLICPAIMAADGCSFKGVIIGSLVIGFAYSAAQYLTFQPVKYVKSFLLSHQSFQHRSGYWRGFNSTFGLRNWWNNQTYKGQIMPLFLQYLTI